jgi:hAT family C-terminal dimerisation region
VKHLQSDTTVRDVVLQALREDGLYDLFKRNCFRIATDGAPVMQGKKAGLAKLLNDVADNNIYTIHCMAHKMQLVITHAFEKIPGFKNHLENTINGIYSFYNDKSFKRKESFIKTAEELGNTFYEVNYIYSSRWVASEFNAVNRIRANYRSLVHNMQSIAEDKSYNTEISAKASGFRNILLHPRFFVMLLFTLDVLQLVQKTSLQCQETSGSVIGKHCTFEKLSQDLEKFKLQNGQFVQNLISSGKCLKDSIWTACTNADLDITDLKMKLQGEDITFSNSKITRQENERWPRLSIIRTQLINAMVLEIREFFPEGSLNLFEVLNPSFIPKNIETLDSYSSKIIPLAERFSFNTATIVAQFSEILNFIIKDMSEEFCTYSNSEPHIFWSHFLNHHLMKWKSDIKKLITIVLILPIGTADVERSFSILNHFKSSRRSRLTPKHVEDITRIRVNGPPISDLDPMKYALHWLTTGHKETDNPGAISRKLNSKKIVKRSGIF